MRGDRRDLLVANCMVGLSFVTVIYRVAGFELVARARQAGWLASAEVLRPERVSRRLPQFRLLQGFPGWSCRLLGCGERWRR